MELRPLNGLGLPLTDRGSCASVHPEMAGFVLAAVDAIRHADRVGAFPLIDKSRRVLPDQDGARCCNETATVGLKMTGEKLRNLPVAILPTSALAGDCVNW
ncbi:hypothetical protein I6F11_29260 [Ensifer sp. NBAIM29]|nr:hypothetical protein [Ensifer sp. NBAIM29]